MNEDQDTSNYFSLEPLQPDFVSVDTDLEDDRRLTSDPPGLEDSIDINSILPPNFCRFCNKQFRQTGSYGRHLDSKKGDDLHPTVEVEKIRKNVTRRNVESKPKDLAQMKEKRKLASARYNAKEDIKERNKMRRKLRDSQIKAKLIANSTFMGKFGDEKPNMETNFAKFCALHVPVALWPHNTLPDASHLEIIQGKAFSGSPIISEETLNHVQQAYQRWQNVSREMQEQSWNFEKWTALKDALGEMTLAEIQHRNQVLESMESKILSQLDDDNDI